MGTIANQKNGGSVQIEFQAIGTSEASIMLQQPLLGTTSESYTVEVTQLMMSLGQEQALSGTEFIMAIVDRPADNTIIDLDEYHTRINRGESEPEAWAEMISDTDPANFNYNRVQNVDAINSFPCYSATDFAYMINHKLDPFMDPSEFNLGI